MSQPIRDTRTASLDQKPVSLVTGAAAIATLLSTAAADRTSCRVAGPITPGSDAETVEPPALARAFLIQVDESGGWVDVASSDRPLLRQWITAGARVHVSLRGDEADLLFTTTLTGHDAARRLADGSLGEAVRFALPAQVVCTGRRKALRVKVTADDGISARIWRINEHVLLRDRVLPSQELRCELRDLSLGGLRVVVRARGDEALRLELNQRFRVELRAGKSEMLFEGRLRYPQATGRDDAFAVCGIQFVNLDRDIDMRRSFQRLQLTMGELQRVVANRAAAA